MCNFVRRTASSSPFSEYEDDVRTIDYSNKPLFSLANDVFSRFRNIISINLSSCQLRCLPPSLFLLQTLEELDISNNYIEVLPCEIGMLKNLNTLKITNNPGASIKPLTEYINDESKLIEFFKKINMQHNAPLPRQYTSQVQQSAAGIFSLMTYNILAPHCVRPERFPFTPEKYLETSYRIPRIQNQIIELMPSIVCLQEVEGSVYNQDFEHFMKQRGYAGFFCPKGRASKCVNKERVHGQATFVKTSQFEVVNHETYEYRNHMLAKPLQNYRELLMHDETVLITVLQAQFNELIVVANIHLYWDMAESQVRVSQLYLAIEIANEIARQYGSRYDIILAGDFNSNYVSDPINYVMHRPDGFINVYPFFGQIPRFSIYTFGFREPLDHIICTHNALVPYAILNMTDENYIKNNYISFPADYFPSDHILLAALFQIKKEKHDSGGHSPPSDEGPKITISKPQKIPFVIKKVHQQNNG